MSELRNPTNKTGRVDTHGVGVPGTMTGIESVLRQQIFGEEEIEAGTIDETIMRTAVRGDSCKERKA